MALLKSRLETHWYGTGRAVWLNRMRTVFTTGGSTAGAAERVGIAASACLCWIG
ncbi:hypothetical protein ACFVW2_09010 [Streptomyces sp. NPDC058171]